MGENEYIRDLIDFDVTMFYLVWFVKYSANVRRTVADFSHAPLNKYSPSPNDKKQWSLVWFDFYKIPKDTEDPSWSTSFKIRSTQKTSSALEALWKTLFMLYFNLIGTFLWICCHKGESIVIKEGRTLGESFVTLLAWCNKCKKIGHLARDCRSSGPNGNNNNRGNSGTTQNAGTCYECGVQGHFKKDCPKLKNGNPGNQRGNGNAPAKVYVVGNAGTNPDSNVVTGTFLLNNRYASILFDTGTDRSFVSTTFSSLIDITPTTLDHYYDVKLADGKIIGINTIIRGCTLNFLNHPFNINVMPVELGSFDVIIGMDWLSKYHAVIHYAEKIVRIPWGNETLLIYGDRSNQGNETRLNSISCTKTQKYLLKGHHVFLAHVTTKETEDKSGEK
ncbi:putative reverse transcriptase domain-containing protein [Tanacetum coccineum]